MFTALISFSLLLLQADIAWSQPQHAIAMHGSAKYLSDFTHFDYVNPNAPKGGEIKLASPGTFDSFNPYIAKGNSGAGSSAETLLTASADEPFTAYGLIAESLETPSDRSWVIFHLRPEAKWHDGKPISVDDVIWSFETLKTKGHPFYRFYYSGVESAKRIGPRSVKFSFSDKTNRELPLTIGQMPVLPKHYWESRDFESTTLEPPLGSGPYKIEKFEPGRYIILGRVDDYWGKNLAVNRGQNNFDKVRIDYYRDETVIREALKSGDIDYREENQAKAWSLDYDTPAVSNGWLKKEKVRHYSPTGMQAFVYNTRREIFSSPLVREALMYAFDFDWTNKNLFFSQYARTQSFFSNSDLASQDLPSDAELEVLEKFRGKIPNRIFSEPFIAPSTDGKGWPRENLKKARALLEEAGWRVKNMVLTNDKTQAPFEFEILLYSEGFERIVLPFTRNLEKLGIKVRVRRVDQSQYINRIRSFDFDMIVSGWGSSESPGNEQRGQWSSAAANSPAASNYAGVNDPVVDELVEKLIQARTREELVTYTRALDRVLLFGFYVIPQWHLQSQRILYWDKFGRPSVNPKSGTSTSLWWFDPDKDQKLREALSSSELPSDQSSNHSRTIGFLVVAVLFIAALVLFQKRRRR